MGAKWLCFAIVCSGLLFPAVANDTHVPALDSDILVVGLTRGLSLVNLTDFNSQYVLRNTAHVFDVDVHRTDISTKVYWSDYEEGRIYSAALENGAISEVNTFVEAGLTTVEGIAVDWIGKNLYWVESKSSMIEVASLENAQWRTILIANIKSPRSVAVDPNAGQMFWSGVSDMDPVIERCSMDGTNRKQVIHMNNMKGGRWPNGVTLDSKSRTIYWIDAKSLAIYSATYDGTNVLELFHGHNSIKWPFGISFLKNSLLWADADLYKVFMINTNGSSASQEAQVVFRGTDWIYGTAVIPGNDLEWQLVPVDNPCYMNGGCSHICLLRSEKEGTCACPFLMMLEPDGKTCGDRNTVSITLVRRDSAQTNDIIVTSQDENNKPLLPIITVVTHFKIDFDIDIRRCLVYWTDGNELWESSCRAGKRIIIQNDELIKNIAVDQHLGTVFYVSENNASIIFARSSNGDISTAVTLQDGCKIVSLLCVAGPRKLIWVSTNNNVTSVQCSNFDGSKFVTIYTKECDVGFTCITDIAVSADQSFIYWVESSSDEYGMTLVELDVIAKADLNLTYELNPKTYVLNNSDTCIITNEKKLHCIGRHYERNDSNTLFEKVNYASMRIVSQGPNLEVANLVITPNIGSQGNKSRSTPCDSGKGSCPWCTDICKNGGKCLPNMSGSNHSCVCTDEFKGLQCESPVCSSVCTNGKCTTDSKGRNVCVCKLGFMGDQCQESVCTGYCQNGKCDILGDGRPNCTCEAGWNGNKCQWSFAAKTQSLVLDGCSVHCPNGGACVVMDDVVYCKCVYNHSGERCQSPGVHLNDGMECNKKYKSLMIGLITCTVICFLLLTTIFFLLRKRIYALKKYSVCKNSMGMQVIGKSGDCQNCFSYSNKFHKNALTNGNMTEDKCILISCDENSCGVYHNDDRLM